MFLLLYCCVGVQDGSDIEARDEPNEPQVAIMVTAKKAP